MRRPKSNRQAYAFTMVEMLVVIAIIGLLAALLLPALSGGKQRAKRIVCESQLRQIGIAFQVFAHDHNSKFPMQVSTNDDGSQEFVQNGNLMNGAFYFGYRNFQPLAGILETPAILVCPADTRLPAARFAALQNSNISYFVGVNAEYVQPLSILAGDGNLAASSTMVHGTAGGRLTWTRQMHEYKGNVLFADGHVEEWSDNGGSTLANNSDLVLPSVSGSTSSASGGLVKPAAQSGAASQGGGPNSGPAANLATIQTGSATNQTAGSTTGRPGPFTLDLGQRQNRITPTAGPSQAGGSNAGPLSVAGTTNLSGTNVSSSKDDNSTMSPANRKAALILREFLGGTYLLLLLLLLLYAIYRIRRWQQDRRRRRRHKTPQRGA